MNVTYADRQQRHTRFLESLHHPAMNARLNEIKAAGAKTFEWVFTNSEPSPEVITLRHWLQSEDLVFLIQGKPGSGKSTFMKFLFKHPQITGLLRIWSADVPVLLLFHSFWQVGSPLQHNYKGLLASLCFQIVESQPAFAEVFGQPPDTRYRKCLNDWSVEELKSTLLELIANSSLRICIFLDGLDEFDRREDFDELENLLQSFRRYGLKICLSTRPHDCILQLFKALPGLRLQDLTAQDIRTHVQKTLMLKTGAVSDSAARNQLVYSLTDTMCQRAEGVFLWVYYVLRNVCHDIRNAEDLKDLLKRVGALPSALVDLYSHMWKSQNEDNKIHAEESAKLFALSRYLPTSVFELTVAMNPTLCEHYA